MKTTTKCGLFVFAPSLVMLSVGLWAQQPGSHPPLPTPPDDSASSSLPDSAGPTVLDPSEEEDMPIAKGRRERTQAGAPWTTPGMPAFDGLSGLSPNLRDPRSQRMYDRLRRIMVLRQLLSLGITTSDVSGALPVLESLRDLDQAESSDPERALDLEYRALLEAEPGSSLPMNSGLKMAEFARNAHEAQAKWRDRLVRTVGRRKAEGLMRLLGDASVAQPAEGTEEGNAAPSNSVTLPVQGKRYGRHPARGKAGDAAFVAPAVGSPIANPSGIVGPVPGAPGRTAETPEHGAAPLRGAADPAAGVTVSTQPNGPKALDHTTSGSALLNPAAQAQPPAELTAPPAGGPRPDGALLIIRPGTQLTPIDYGNITLSPDAVRVSLAELIDILHDKLKVMQIRHRGPGNHDQESGPTLK